MDDSQIRALVIDDDDFALELMRCTFASIGINRCRLVERADEALRILTENPTEIDLIACDLNMPEVDGVELLRELAEIECTAPIIIVSGSDERVLNSVEQLAAQYRLNILGCITKPVTGRKLKALIKREWVANGETQVTVAESVTLEELERAIEHELELHYQPKVEVNSGQVIGVEALVRWKPAHRTPLNPFLFVAAAEQFGLIDALTESVYKQALSTAALWAGNNIHLKMSVNISVENLKCLDLPDKLLATATVLGINPADVILEITETCLIEDLVVSLDIVSRLRIKGFNLSVDDFGTGYSSLEKLKQFPFTELKIDRFMVDGASKDITTRTMLESTVEMAKKLNLLVTAEGVETKQDWDLVAGLNCDLVQGYFIAKPMPEAEFIKWLNARNQPDNGTASIG